MTYTLDSSAQASWRTNATSVDLYLFLHQPEVVFAAQINMPIVPYPLPFIFYDNVTTGAYTDLEEDMLVLIGSTPGADDLGRTRVRMSGTADVVANSSVVFIHNSSQGAFDGEVDVVDDAYVTVLNAHWLWSVAPYIDPNGLILEDFDHIFTDAVHLLPIAPAGVDFLIVLDNVGDEVTLDFGEYAAYATAPGASIVDESWSFPDGQTSTSATPQITFEADTVGYYSRTVEDSLGNIKTSWRFMAVVNKNHTNLIKDFEITNHTARVDGQEMQVIIHQDIPYGTYPDGTEALIAMRERRGSTIGGLVGSPGFEDMLFAGWLGQENMTGEAGRSGYLSQTTLTLLDSAGKLKTLPGFTEVKEREDTPTTWAHMKGANIDRYVVSILDHRSNAARRVDIIWSGTGEDYAFTILGSDGGNLYDQADLRCQAIAYKLTCDRYGRLIMRPDPQLQAEADKTTDIIVPIAETDWSQMQRVYNRSPRTHWNWGEAIQTSTGNASDELNIVTLWNVSPGNAPGQGLASATSGEQLAQSQEELDIRERKRYEARLNSLFGNIQVLLARDGYFCDPSLFKWVQLEITSEHAGVRGRSWVSTTRFLPLEMTYRYDHQRGTREQRITLEKEVVTTRKAVIYTPPQQPGFTVPPLPDYSSPDLSLSGFLGLFRGIRRIAVVYSNGRIGITSNFESSSPTYVVYDLSGTLGTNCLAFTYDPRSQANAAAGWVVTSDAVYYVSGIGANMPTAVLLYTFGTSSNFRCIDASWNWSPGQFVIIASNYGGGGGVKSLTLENGAVLFGGEVTVNSNNQSSGTWSPGVAWSPHVPGMALTTAFSATGGDGDSRPYRSFNAGQSWAVHIDLPTWGDEGLAGDIHIPLHNNPSSEIFYFGSTSTISSPPMTNNTRALSRNPDEYEFSDILGFGPLPNFNGRQIATAPQNASRIVIAANNLADTVRRILASSDNGINWNVVDDGTDYRRVALVDDNTLFLYGENDAIGYSEDFGASVDSRVGNLAVGSEIIGITGY